jgi:diguanylate cyclase (GGDEF)-like protein
MVISEIELKHANADLVTDLTAQQQRLTELALHDGLTGLMNRRGFQQVLHRAVEAARRDGGIVGVVFFDIDRFKIVNDSLGHAAGDELLRVVAARVSDVIRDSDVLARVGGDEFVVLLDRLGDSYEAFAIAQRMRMQFDEPVLLDGRRVHAAASIGVATNLHSSDGAEDLLRHADTAQYRAKVAGGNRVEVFDIELRRSLERRLEAERELREGLAAGQIVPYFQPQIDLATGRIIAVEALARWLHPTRGVLGAPEFVPLAEDVGLIADLDDAVAAQAIRARVALGELGVDHSFRIWCNISPKQLTRVGPVQRLENFLGSVGCDPGGIGMEITETAVLADAEAGARELAAARRLGVRIALDDFGTGRSSLTLLRALPIDSLKIDRSFVVDMVDDQADAAIVAGVIDLAHRLGLEVVAEGVEDEAQERMLRELGCDCAQGFRYGHAVPLDDLIPQLGLGRPARDAAFADLARTEG